MQCPRCNIEAEYHHVDTRNTSSQLFSAKQHGHQAGKALAGGHPAAAVVALIAPLATMAWKTYQNTIRWKCPRCGKKF